MQSSSALETPRTMASGNFLPDGSFVCAIGSLTADEVALAKVNFRKFDVDGDGIISRGDFGAAMGKHDASWRSSEKAAQLDSMYAAVDIDGTGTVSFDKFAVMRVRKKLTAAERAKAQKVRPPAAGALRDGRARRKLPLAVDWMIAFSEGLDLT